MSSAPAYLPLFGSDYLADTRHLTTEEHGAYLLLMVAAWRQDDCGLPLDDKKLARIVGLSTRKWVQIKDTILEFWKAENGRIYQPRLRKEWTYACKKSEGNRENARKRWSKQVSENIDSDECDRISERNAPQPQPHIEEPNGSPIYPRETRSRKSRSAGTNERSEGLNPRSTKRNPRSQPQPNVEIPDWMPAEPWQAFLDMRRHKRATPTGRAIALLIGKLEGLRARGHDPGAVLDQSTLKNWTDVYEIKEPQNADRNGQANGRHASGHRGPDRRDGLDRYLDDQLISADRHHEPAQAVGQPPAGDGRSHRALSGPEG